MGSLRGDGVGVGEHPHAVAAGGTALGLALGYNIIADSAKQPSWDTLSFTVPWLSLSVVFLLVYAVALLTTLAPAVRGSRVYPAEALRYQ